MNALKTRKNTVTALCFLLLAVYALLWSATAGTDEGAGEERNTFARFSSDSVEVLGTDGQVLYSVPFTHPLRALTPSGEVCAAWAPGGEVLFLGRGGYKTPEVPGRVLGVFGSECGAVVLICETGSGDTLVTVYGAGGPVFTLQPEDFFPVAATVSPDALALALLAADGYGYSLRTYSLNDGEALTNQYLDGEAYSIKWEDAAPEVLYLQREATSEGG